MYFMVKSCIHTVWQPELHQNMPVCPTSQYRTLLISIGSICHCHTATLRQTVAENLPKNTATPENWAAWWHIMVMVWVQLSVGSLSNLITDKAVIYQKLSEIKYDKSAGPDNVPPWVLFELRNEICKPLKTLFELSLQTGKTPTDWRSAVTTALC